MTVSPSLTRSFIHPGSHTFTLSIEASIFHGFSTAANPGCYPQRPDILTLRNSLKFLRN